MTRRELLHMLVKIDTAIALTDQALGDENELKGASATLVMSAQRHLRSVRDSLRAELGLGVVVPFPTERETA